MVALTMCGGLQAQDIYKIEALSGSDLNGTARYVGMGGAMNVLGADLSTMSTNPAAIGMYRRLDVAVTGSATIQPNGEEMGDINRARGSFDQAGFVYAFDMGNSKTNYINFGFNYQKRRNFKNYIGLDGIATQNGLSQSWQMRDLALYNNTWLNLEEGSMGTTYTTPLAITGYDCRMIAPLNSNGEVIGRNNIDRNTTVSNYAPSTARTYDYHRAQWGGIQEYDFNLSFNYNNRFYGGLTLGVYNVDLHSQLAYSELLEGSTNANGVTETGYYNMSQYESLTGIGFDAKFGVIFRPIEDSPFRIGMSFSTPIFYDLTANAHLDMNSPYTYVDKNGNEYNGTKANYDVGDFDYRMRTPWKLNIGLATTVGNYLALDAEYEVSRYTGAQVRYPDENRSYYEWDDYRYTRSTRDREMDKEIDNYLNTVQTFRIGAEVRLAQGLYGRVGYNFVSSPFKKDAYLNNFTDSPSYNYSTTTDYANLSCLHRATVGLGYRCKHFYADMAYQFQKQHADVFAFNGGYDNDFSKFYALEGQRVDLNRHNIMFTLGYKF